MNKPDKENIPDVLIIGAGATGAAVAWSLSKDGISVMCLDQGDWVPKSQYHLNETDWELSRWSDFHQSPNYRKGVSDYPINDGCFRNLKSIVPMGKVVSAVRPAPMRWWMTFPMTVVDTVFKALEPAIPERVIAGHHADLIVVMFHGLNPRTNEFFIGNFGPLGGGWGAKLTEDGRNGVVCINDGDTHNSPNEQAEVKYPVLVESNSLIMNSGGPGKHRGGLGIERIVQARTNMIINTQIDRVHCKPWGLNGG